MFSEQVSLTNTVADPEGVHSNPPLKQNHFIFKVNFQKNQEKLINNQVKLTNQTPLCKMNPLSRNPGSVSATIKKIKLKSDQLHTLPGEFTVRCDKIPLFFKPQNKHCPNAV